MTDVTPRRTRAGRGVRALGYDHAVTELMLVAIDWSGRFNDRGRTAWMAVIEDGVFRRLENSRSRPELRDELIRLRGKSGRLVAGVDFAFGFPQWYAKANGWTCGRDIWRAAYRDGESWLTSAAGPFWGRTTKRPQHPGDPLSRTSGRLAGHRGQSSRSAARMRSAPGRFAA